jgi:hypothetical protein
MLSYVASSAASDSRVARPARLAIRDTLGVVPGTYPLTTADQTYSLQDGDCMRAGFSVTCPGLPLDTGYSSFTFVHGDDGAWTFAAAGRNTTEGQIYPASEVNGGLIVTIHEPQVWGGCPLDAVQHMRFTQLGVNNHALMVVYTFSNDTCWQDPGLSCPCAYDINLQSNAAPSPTGDTPQPIGGDTSGAHHGAHAVHAVVGVALAAGALPYLLT